MKKEIRLGDDKQGIVLKFQKDGLWVSGAYEEHEIPYKCVLWTQFDEARFEAEKDETELSLYERFRDNRHWQSNQPDMSSFLLAISQYFDKTNFRLSGRRLASRLYDDNDEHTVLIYKNRDIVWDFGPLNGQLDSAWAAAFRHFADNIPRVQSRVAQIDNKKSALNRLFGAVLKVFSR